MKVRAQPFVEATLFALQKCAVGFILLGYKGVVIARENWSAGEGKYRRERDEIKKGYLLRTIQSIHLSNFVCFEVKVNMNEE